MLQNHFPQERRSISPPYQKDRRPRNARKRGEGPAWGSSGPSLQLSFRLVGGTVGLCRSDIYFANMIAIVQTVLSDMVYHL